MFQYFVEPEGVLEGWLKESTSKVGIWWTYPRNLCTSAGGRALLARRDISSPAEIFSSIFPADFIGDVLSTILEANPDAFYSNTGSHGTRNTKVNPADVYQASRVGFGFRIEGCQLELLRR